MAQGKKSELQSGQKDSDSPNSMEGGSLAAHRYAMAICDLGEDHKSLDAIAEDMDKLSQTLRTVPEFASFIANPTLTAEKQKLILQSIVTELKLHDLTRRLIGVLVENSRVALIPAVIRSFRIEIQRRQGAQTAVVTSSQSLSEAQVAKLLARLQGKYGQGIKLQQRVDPSLIGGLSVEIGTVLIDYSLKSKLARLELVMKGAV
ncbi:MAG: ATP synthase F1 subunit delta [Candidatus Pacebacteria bacterium]|nr:ATP synthase F1 subunit delta [Candidatus Paceibacterota bacterium]